LVNRAKNQAGYMFFIGK